MEESLIGPLDWAISHSWWRSAKSTRQQGFIRDKITSYHSATTSAFDLVVSNVNIGLLSIPKFNPSKKWQIPPKYPKYVYKLHGWQYVSHYFIKTNSKSIPFSGTNEPINLNFINPDIIDWANKKGFSYARVLELWNSVSMLWFDHIY